MSGCPQLNELTRRLGINATGNLPAVETELRLLTLILCMEVRRLVLPLEHPNHNPEESRNDRHAIEFTVARKIRVAV